VAATDRFQSAIDVANALAEVDGEILDWQLTKLPDRRQWEKNESGTLLEFTATNDGATECFKTAAGGQRRRVRDGCKTQMTDRDIRTFLGGH
jgi:hypothetical protein